MVGCSTGLTFMLTVLLNNAKWAIPNTLFALAFLLIREKDTSMCEKTKYAPLIKVGYPIMQIGIQYPSKFPHLTWGRNKGRQ